MKQIGTDILPEFRIVKRCIHGYPVVILFLPRYETLHKKEKEYLEIFYKTISNVLWLSCPYLNEKIHALESDHYITKIASFIKEKRKLEEMMISAHAHYYYLRKSLLYQYYGEYKNNTTLLEISKKGIAGITDTGNLKCLHSHYAHYSLCGKNCAGRITAALIGDAVSCDDNICRKMIDEQ